MSKIIKDLEKIKKIVLDARKLFVKEKFTPSSCKLYDKQLSEMKKEEDFKASMEELLSLMAIENRFGALEENAEPEKILDLDCLGKIRVNLKGHREEWDGERGDTLDVDCKVNGKWFTSKRGVFYHFKDYLKQKTEKPYNLKNTFNPEIKKEINKRKAKIMLIKDDLLDFTENIKFCKDVKYTIQRLISEIHIKKMKKRPRGWDNWEDGETTTFLENGEIIMDIDGDTYLDYYTANYQSKLSKRLKDKNEEIEQKLQDYFTRPETLPSSFYSDLPLKEN